jgi:hypothetical protein
MKKEVITNNGIRLTFSKKESLEKGNKLFEKVLTKEIVKKESKNE